MRQAAELAKEIQRAGGLEAYKRQIQDARDAALRRRQGLDDPQSIAASIKAAERARTTDFRALLETFESMRNVETRRLLENLNYKFRLPDEFINPRFRITQDMLASKRLLEDYSRSFQVQLRDLQQAFSPARELLEQINTSGANWLETIRSASERASSPLTARAIESSLAWRISTEGVAERLRSLDLFNTHPRLAEHLILPGVTYTRFATSTLARIEQTTDEAESDALTGSLILAEDQMVESAAMLETTIIVPVEAESIIVPTIYNSFTVQQQELLAHGSVPKNAEPPQLIEISPAARLTALSRRCVSLVTHCNKANSLRGGTDIFKPTTKFVEACNDLPWMVAQDQHTLANFVEGLYFILYEAAGARNLRFITEGLVEPEDCEAIWAVKFLRNKWLSHDPDHGSEGDAQRTWRNLNEALVHLGITRMPQTPADFMQVQRRVLEEVGRFLQLLIEKINSAPRSET
ncbi:MAG TPA: hypothetical protein VK619_04295 [Pyrinomonadaceae bacterium]|nr:hypothetical protein [Pyrinomonadaceae bacterium]